MSDTARGKILESRLIGVRRTFENDPRLGLCVLSEIASRVLSPAVNAPGTAIDVIGRGVRTLTCWSKLHYTGSQTGQGCEQVFLRGLTADDLFFDFFAPISRDGAALLEVKHSSVKSSHQSR
ncbi:DUF2254 family protein [Pseudomonas sp. 008]|uniref:DUF2254 family protein n=1 Tax=Pseudomonas sp. 008 TaxID=2803906 RepID=UPI0035B541D4